ncbi:MAG TPA: ATP-binding protein [Steroidobacteraceae bacterium]|nr:ATP-binding protein [Steroidobacteraceae bacterium]
MTALARGHAEGCLEEKLLHYGKPKLLVIDERGCLPFGPNAAHLFLQLVSRRYERGSIPVTSNRSIAECGSVLINSTSSGDQFLVSFDVYRCGTFPIAILEPSTETCVAEHDWLVKQKPSGDLRTRITAPPPCSCLRLADEPIARAAYIRSPTYLQLSSELQL